MPPQAPRSHPRRTRGATTEAPPPRTSKRRPRAARRRTPRPRPVRRTVRTSRRARALAGAAASNSAYLLVPAGLCQRNIRKGWVQHRWCRPCKLANDAYYARENAAQATPVTSNPEFRTVSPAAPATSDGETSPANAVAPSDELQTGDELRAASPATPVASGVKPLEMNWLQAAKGSLHQAEH